jgi:predicted membrane-bound spermidine synthase
VTQVLGVRDRADASTAYARRLLTVSVVALCSGAAAIVYQINWQRDLVAILGVSHYATTTVIFAFFLGLAVGAQIARERLDRIGNVFGMIILLEGTIAAFAWLAPALFDLLGRSAAAITPPLAESSKLATLPPRAALSIIALILPTTCMGATLPCFYKAGIVVQRRRGSRIGLISGLNTLGAFLGALLATFVLMGRVSGDLQLRIASLLNLAAVATCVPLYSWVRRNAPLRATTPRPRAARLRDLDPRLLAAFALSGAAGLALEIVWYRLAYMSSSHTVYTFALTHTVYLAGFGSGNLVAGRALQSIVPTRNHVALLQLAALVSTLAGFAVFRSGALNSFQLVDSFGHLGGALAVIVVYVFPPTFFMGLAMPLVLHRLTGELADIGRDASRAQLVNNAGSIVAICLVGYVLVPLAGLYWVSLFCLALLAAGWLLLFDPAPLGRFSPAVLRAGALAATVGVLAAYPSSIYDGFKRWIPGTPVAYAEDEFGFWSITRNDEVLVLYQNAYYENHVEDPPEGSVDGSYLLAAIVRPTVGDVFSIGLGLGVNAYEVLRLPSTRSVTVADYSTASVALARGVWARFPYDIFRDPRFSVIHEDGRTFLEHGGREYDVIDSGTVRSFQAGSTHIYSAEFFRLARERLRPDGVMVQWLPPFSEYSVEVLLKSFLSAFPDALVLRHASELNMIGFRDGIPTDFESQVAAALRRSSIPLAEMPFRSSRDFFGSLYIPRRRALERRASVPLNRDDLPTVEYSFRGFERVGDTSETGYPIEKIADPYTPERLARYRGLSHVAAQ